MQTRTVVVPKRKLLSSFTNSRYDPRLWLHSCHYDLVRVVTIRQKMRVVQLNYPVNASLFVHMVFIWIKTSIFIHFNSRKLRLLIGRLLSEDGFYFHLTALEKQSPWKLHHTNIECFCRTFDIEAMQHLKSMSCNL